MAKSDAAQLPAPAPKLIRISNIWNQVVNVVLSDGSEKPIRAKSYIEVDSKSLSDQINTLQTRGVVRLKEVTPPPAAKA